MAAAQCTGNDATIACAASSGNFQLNVMLPVIAYNLLQSIEILSNASLHLAPVIDSFRVNSEIMAKNLQLNPILVTALNPLIGYQQAAEIAKTAVRQNRPILEVALQMTDLDESQLADLLDPLNLLGNDLEKPE
jgi:fumarate hydratase class II